MNVVWAFGGVPFRWFTPEVNGLPVSPTWRSPSRLIVRGLLGGGDADIIKLGYEPQRISGPVIVEAAHHAAFLALDGVKAVLTDGSTSWTAVGQIELASLWVPSEGATGTVAFTRVRS